MRRTRLTSFLLGTALLTVVSSVAACGTATSPPAGSRGSGGHETGAPLTVRSYADGLLSLVTVPGSATVAAAAPRPVLGAPPERPGLAFHPLVVKRYWTVDRSAAETIGWLRQHRPNSTWLASDGSGGVGRPTGVGDLSYLSYQARRLPSSMALGDVYVAVAPLGPSRAGVAAYALALRQPPRPAAEVVPVNGTSVTLSWSLAVGGTPALKRLGPAEAASLIREFNALRVDTRGPVPCPMIPTRMSDLTITFAGGGHRVRATVPICPSIGVTRDGHHLPALALEPAFTADLHRLVPVWPGGATRSHGGGVIPLHVPASH